MVERLNSLIESTFSKLIYTFNVIPAKITLKNF